MIIPLKVTLYAIKINTGIMSGPQDEYMFVHSLYKCVHMETWEDVSKMPAMEA